MTLIVLLVEDSHLIRENLIPTLEELVPARVVKVTESEEEARNWLQGHSDWQLAVVDLFLKQGSGLGVVRALQGRQPFQRVVVLSNYATHEMRTQCERLGADAVFDKSTELDPFLAYCTRCEQQRAV